ncbi:MAG TPA: response regulator [Thermoanaerobaculia bacterium]|nr:response regulator [Thermoanaerobaculia bacterium]
MKPLALVVENDLGTRRLLNVLLTRFGFEVDLVPSGSDALLLVEHAEYDLLLVSLMLPGVSGMEVLQRIEQNRPEMLARCVVLSSGSPVQLGRIAQKWPQVRGIRKPFELAEITDIAHQAAAGQTHRTDTPDEQFCRLSVRLGAKSGVVLRRNGSFLEDVLSYGYRREMLDRFVPMPVDAPYPLCAALRNARPVWIASVTLASPDYLSLVPVWQKNESHALASLPLIQNGIAIGVAGWAFREPRPFQDEERAAFQAIADSIAPLLSSAPRSDSRAHA